MTAWFTFWMIAVGISALLFFGVAVLVAIFGWRDLCDLYAQQQSNTDPAESSTDFKTPPRGS